MADVIRDVILGGQDGMVNVLGLALGVATATGQGNLVLVSGLAGTFAESISMAAVTYTGFKAARDVNRRKYHDGISRKLLFSEYGTPFKSAVIVGISSFVGSVIPLVPFALLTVRQAMIASVVSAIIILFGIGSIKGVLARQSWVRTGIEMAVIGTLAAVSGFVVGELVKPLLV